MLTEEIWKMRASVLLDACEKAGIDFFTGVPDSLLKGLCNELYDRYGTEGDTHVVAHNEGGAVGLCAGHYLSCGRPALCYMQNSGLGNAVNPLASLMDHRLARRARSKRRTAARQTGYHHPFPAGNS